MSEIAFHRPPTLAAAIAILAADDEARCLAGGQTLTAMLNADLLEPSALVSLARIPELHGITPLGGGLRIGALATHREIAGEARLAGTGLVLREAARRIAHPAIRNMGTIGGSLCHADPVSDYPAAVVAADAVLVVEGPDGARRIPAGAFFKDFLTTDLAAGEILVALELPAPPPGSTGHYLKYARVDGDYATVSVALALALEGGLCTHARIALGASGPVPIQSHEAEAVLIGSPLSEATIGEAGRLLAAASKPLDDVRGSAQYRRRIIPNLVRRALLTAEARSMGAGQEGGA